MFNLLPIFERRAKSLSNIEVTRAGSYKPRQASFLGAHLKSSLGSDYRKAFFIYVDGNNLLLVASDWQIKSNSLTLICTFRVSCCEIISSPSTVKTVWHFKKYKKRKKGKKCINLRGRSDRRASTRFGRRRTAMRVCPACRKWLPPCGNKVVNDGATLVEYAYKVSLIW